MTGVYRVRNETLRVLHEKAKERLALFDEVTFEGVSRTANRRADRLCGLVFKWGHSFSDDVDEVPEVGRGTGRA
jgi:hypothetical protein